MGEFREQIRKFAPFVLFVVFAFTGSRVSRKPWTWEICPLPG